MAHWKFSLEPARVPQIETKYRRIVTSIPVPESLGLLAELERYETRAMHGQLPVVWDRAEGFLVHDPWGNIWIDFTSTIFVANAGHSNPRIVQALREQLDRPLLHTYTFPSKVRTDYLRYLIQSTPPQFEKAFLLSAGTEATECALKLMRLHGQKIGKKRGGIIALEGNWHGRTMGAQMLSYNPQQKEWIGYLDPGIYHLPFPYPWRDEAMKDPREFFRSSLARLAREKSLDVESEICGFLLETFQGWGAIFYPDSYVQELTEFAHRYDILVAFDEMQAGFGRTGTLFGYMQYGVEPDLICCGKGAASGLPLSIVLGRQHIMDLPEIGSMSSTHSANPLACAAGLANLRALVEDGLLTNARTLGEFFQERLRELQARFSDHVRYVFGRGLLAAIHLVDQEGNPLPDVASRICEEAMRRGLLVVHTGRESIKLAPPLCISREALLEGLGALEESLAAVVGRGPRSFMLSVRHIGIVVSDLGKALHFYRDLLGMHVVRTMDESGPYLENLLALKDARVTTVKLSSAMGSAQVELVAFKSEKTDSSVSPLMNRVGQMHVAITIEDVDATYRRLTESGIRFNAAPQISPDGYAKVTYCYDPDGTPVELVQVLERSEKERMRQS